MFQIFGNLDIYIKEEVNTGTPLFNDTRRFVQNSGHIICYCLKDRLKGQNNLNFWINLIALQLV